MNEDDKKAPLVIRPHIYEIDLIRGVTVFSVVMLHSLATTQFLTAGNFQLDLINLFIHLLHYGREIFIFVTGLVLTYTYFGRPFSAKKFWLRRIWLIFVPYVFWSVIYVKINNHTLGVADYFNLVWQDILDAGASYQLYYILLALQLYLIFPLFIIFLRKVAKHPWTTLSISFLIQMVLLYFDFYFLQEGKVNLGLVTNFILPFQDRFFLSYEFFFILGAFGAIYIDKGYGFLKKFGKYLPAVLLVTLTFYTGYYYYLVQSSNNVFYATSVIQPSVVVYSLVIIIFYLWLSTAWVKRLKHYKIIKIISDTSFGIYFVHVFILALIVKYVLPFGAWAPAPLQILFVIFATFVISVMFCFSLLKIRFLSWAIGRGGKK